MSEFGRKLRLQRICPSSRKALIVAFDHALVLGPIRGTIEPSARIRCFAQSGVDAILMNFGMVHGAADSMLMESPPALILRLDWTSLWTADKTDGKLVSRMLGTVADAVRWGADAVLTYLFVGTGDAEFESDEIARNAAVARECERLGMPLIVESLARGQQVKNPLAPEWMNLHTRVAAEIGADLIKTEYTGDPASMAEIVNTCPIPIMVLGGARQGSDEEALETIAGVAASGAAGVFFGRNVFQSNGITEFLRRARQTLDSASMLDRF